MEPEEREQVARVLAAQADPHARSKVGLYPVPVDWEDRLRATVPKYVVHPFAERHRKFWQWVNAITLDSSPDPEVDIWPRGGGKSTGGELAAQDLGCRDARRYCLYVRETQAQADQSVQNIAALLESPAIAVLLPAPRPAQRREVRQREGLEAGAPHHGRRVRRRRGRPGHGHAWPQARGAAARPHHLRRHRRQARLADDDRQEGGDITHSILPAGSWNCAVLFVQNLIIPDGIASRLADGRADYLAKRHVNGPYPAVEGLKYEWKEDPTTKIRRAVIVKGKATWAGQPIATCQRMIDQFGLSAFLKECQHRVRDRAEGVVLRFRAADEIDEATGETAPSHYIDLSDDECRQLVADALRSKRLSISGGIDFGAWRFAFTLWVVTDKGVVIRIDEYFAQRLEGEAGLAERARAIHETMEFYGIPVDAIQSRDTESEPKTRTCRSGATRPTRPTSTRSTWAGRTGGSARTGSG
jgi:hypothetical protein